jgi:hypothetical protein
MLVFAMGEDGLTKMDNVSVLISFAFSPAGFTARSKLALTTRAAEIAAERSAFTMLANEGRLPAVIGHDWTGFPGKTEDAAAIFRCGSLTEAGKLALSPM